MNLRPLSPSRYWNALVRVIRARLTPAATDSGGPRQNTSTYADLYEQHATALAPNTSIGDGDFDRIGQVELAILTTAGLTPAASLFDFGCGTGRLAVHAVPFLAEGRYVGSDISPTMLRHAEALLAERFGGTPGYVTFVVQPDERFPITSPPDMICAFSVFTHMEHEDIYRYLCAAREISAMHTIFVATCLQLDLPEGRNIFMMSAAKTVDERWREVRNVVTSRDLFTNVAELAGWTVTDWHGAEGPAGTMPDGSRVGLGQSVVVMRPAAEHADINR